jgi:membrane protein DedA with SNARE-associated domain
MEFIFNLFNDYGYIILFLSLTLELIAFPLPGEIMMTYCGFLIYESKMNLYGSLISASMGVILGITLAYIIGSKLGVEFINKYFSYFHINKNTLEKPSNWFNSYGNNLLLFAYFIPGVRHITGYFSGISKISFKKFAINAYLGAILWTFTFISLGMFLGPNWEKLDSYISKYISYIFILILIIISAVYSYKNKGFRLIKFSFKALNNSIIYIYSFTKSKQVMNIMNLAFIGILALIIGIIQDYITSDSTHCNFIATYYIKGIFNNHLTKFIPIFRLLTSYVLIIPLIVLFSIIIIKKSSSPTLSLQFLFTTIIGGEVLCSLLNNIFKSLRPASELYNSSYTLPSHEGIMSIVVYGYLTYLLLDNIRNPAGSVLLCSLALLICTFCGIGSLLSTVDSLSDVLSGYVFGLVWLTINIVLLRIYKIINCDASLSLA